MKKAKIIICAFVVLLVSIALIVLLIEKEPEVNNTVSADSLITKEYSLERLMLIEAIFNVRSGFEDVTAKDLARENDVKLECKRQTSSDSFYYILAGDGYRCFIFVDSDDIVENTIVMRQFATCDEVAQIVTELSLLGDKMSIDEVSQYNLKDSFYVCCTASGCDYLYFPLSDGVMIMRRPHLYNDIDAPEYYYYTDEEWPDPMWEVEFSSWNCFCEILPLDKAPW